MSKISKLKKDKMHRRNFSQKELKIIKFKYCLLNSKIKKQKWFYVYRFMNRFHLNWSRSRIVYKCLMSGRSRWVIRKYKLSRMMFKDLCDNGKIHGVRRASW